MLLAAQIHLIQHGGTGVTCANLVHPRRHRCIFGGFRPQAGGETAAPSARAAGRGASAVSGAGASSAAARPGTSRAPSAFGGSQYPAPHRRGLIDKEEGK